MARRTWEGEKSLELKKKQGDGVLLNYLVLGEKGSAQKNVGALGEYNFRGCTRWNKEKINGCNPTD